MSNAAGYAEGKTAAAREYEVLVQDLESRLSEERQKTAHLNNLYEGALDRLREAEERNLSNISRANQALEDYNLRAHMAEAELRDLREEHKDQ